MEILDNYKKNLINSINSLDDEKINELVDKILQTRDSDGTVFVAGNGGSAATASHFVCDLQKTVLGKNPTDVEFKRIKVMSLVDSIPSITAWSNDVDYKVIFSEQLKSYGKNGDLLILISGSGNSENIIEAIHAAKELEIFTYGLLGFEGGIAKDMLDDYIIVNIESYGVIEDAHSIIMHMITEVIKTRL